MERSLKGVAGLAWIKMGLCHAPADWRDRLAVRLGVTGVTSVKERRGRMGFEPVAVAYADFRQAESPPPVEILDWAMGCEVNVFLIDTAIKDGRCLLDHMPPTTLLPLIERARRAGIQVALAGSLQAIHVPRVFRLGASILAVRGAVCEQANRQAKVCGSRVTELKAILAACRSSADRTAGSPV